MITDCERLGEMVSLLNAHIVQVDSLDGVDDALRDSLLSEYSCLRDTMNSLYMSSLGEIASTTVGSISTLLDSCIIVRDHLERAESFLGFFPYETGISSWQLRNILVDSLQSYIADQLVVHKIQLDSIAASLALILSHPVEITERELLEISLIKIDTKRDSLNECIDRLDILADSAEVEIERHRFSYLLNNRIRVSDDPATNCTFYYHTNSPRYTNSRSCTCYAYVGRSGGSRWLRFVVGYSRSEWVFVEEIKFNIDTELISLEFDTYDDLDSSTRGWGVCEWVSIPANINLLEKIASGNEVYISFIGRNRRYSPQLTQSDITAISEMLEFYRLFDHLDN